MGIIARRWNILSRTTNSTVKSAKGILEVQGPSKTAHCFGVFSRVGEERGVGREVSEENEEKGGTQDPLLATLQG